MEGHALATALCVLPSRRQLPATTKHKSLLLLSLLLQAAIGSLSRSNVQPGSISGHIYDVSHTANDVELVFGENGMTRGLASFPHLSPRCVNAWRKLCSGGWCGRTVSSALEYGVWPCFAPGQRPCKILCCRVSLGTCPHNCKGWKHSSRAQGQQSNPSKKVSPTKTKQRRGSGYTHRHQQQEAQYDEV